MKKTDCSVSGEVRSVINRFNDRERYYQKTSLKRCISLDEFNIILSKEEDTVEYALEVSLEKISQQQRILALKKHSLTYQTMNIR